MKEKVCPKCQKKLPVSSFYSYYSTTRNTWRISNYCKECGRKDSNKRAKQHYKDNCEEKKAYAKNYRVANKQLIKEKRPVYKEKQITELQYCYVSDLLVTKNGISRDFIKENPDIIETKRLEIKIKRKLKNILKNGKK